MKPLLAFTLALVSTHAGAQTLAEQFPSCDLEAQHALQTPTGGAISDPRQAHVSMRANILQADLSSASKSGRLTRSTATRLVGRVETVRTAAARDASRQGFLTARGVAAHDRVLDAIAARACRR